MTLEQAYQRCTVLARTHYENFPVGWIVPKHLRPHVHAVYAFARTADDFADEGYLSHNAPSQEQRTQSLQHYEAQLSAALNGQEVDPQYEWIFNPLKHTIEEYQLPHSLFYDLLSAFQQDVIKSRYETFEEVLDYCRRSANPVGRLVLHLHKKDSPENLVLSDYICTALQLTNFWQDISVDLKKNRIYIPLEDQRAFGFAEEDLFQEKFTQNIRECVEFQVNRTQQLFEKGEKLSFKLPIPLSWEIRLTYLGGMTILKKIRKLNYNSLNHRPSLSKWDILSLLPLILFSR